MHKYRLIQFPIDQVFRNIHTQYMTAQTTSSNGSTNSQQTADNIDVTSPYTPRHPTPIVSISMNNPLGIALRKIKNFLTHKQTLFATSFTIKVTPLVALVSLLGVTALFGGGITTAYNFGKTVEQKFLATSPTPSIPQSGTSPTATQQTLVNVSRAGIVKATYQNPPASDAASSSLQPTNKAASDAASQTTQQPILHYILVDRTGALVYLSSKSVSLQKYLNLRVLITGSFTSTTNTLSIRTPTDIEILQ